MGPFQRALVVESEPVLEDTISGLLSAQKIPFTVVHDGDDGIAAARDVCPDLVVVNMRLPTVSGMDFLTLLRYVLDVEHAYIVAVEESDVIDPGEAAQLAEYGVDKIVTPGGVISLLQNLPTRDQIHN